VDVLAPPAQALLAALCLPQQSPHPGDVPGRRPRPWLWTGQTVERAPRLCRTDEGPAAPRPAQRFQPYLTFSCQGSFRATAEGSSGSLRKEVGVCASCSDSRRLRDRAKPGVEGGSSITTRTQSLLDPKRLAKPSDSPQTRQKRRQRLSGGGRASPARPSHASVQGSDKPPLPAACRAPLNPCRCFFSGNPAEKFCTLCFLHPSSQRSHCLGRSRHASLT